MKLSIETKVLAEALRFVSVAFTGRMSSLPILSHVKLDATGEKLILSTTDLDLFATHSVTADVSEPGAVTTPLAVLAQLVTRIQSSLITLETDGTSLAITGGDISALLETLPAEEFPPTLEKDGGKQVGCDAAEVIEPFRMLAPAMSKDTSRYTLMGINVAPGKKGTDFAATNGTWLSVYHSDAVLTDESVIVADMYVKALLRLQPTGAATVRVSDGVVTFATNGTRLSGKLIEGSYPNYKQFVPKGGDKVFSCGRKELINAITTCAIFTERDMPGLRLTGKGKELEIARRPKSRARLLGSELSGQPDFSIAFNSRHMLETLGVMRGDDVRIACTDDNEPMLIREDGFASILVPIDPEKC